jgi:glycosyltransferase involved in cell wall biosynthesis
VTTLFLDQFSDPGGAQQMLLDLLPAVRSRGWKGVIALPGSGALFQQVRELGFETAVIRCGPYASGAKSMADAARFLADVPRLAVQIGRLAREVRPDLIYINGPRLLPAAALARFRAPVLFHAHSYLPPGVIRKLAGASLRAMKARVVGCSRYVAEPWDALGPAVIYNGVAGPGSPVRSPREGPPRIGCIGRIAPEKGQLDFLATAALIHRRIPGARFFIYGAALFGDAAAARYEARVHQAAANLPVEFAGWIRDVYPALAGLDLLLVPSAAHEASTRVILEGFAAGVPVIAFGRGGIPEAVDHGRDGFLAASVEEMATIAIDLLSAGGSRVTDVSQAARATWESRFTLSRYREQMLDVMCEAANRRL